VGPVRSDYHGAMLRLHARKLVILVCLIAACDFVHPYLAIAYLQRTIAGATSASAETEALCRANRWFHSGYTPTYDVTTRDADGAELRPWQDGSYERVAWVRLTWSTGQSVERTLLTRDALGCVFGE
jgi:hypothetical protein